MEFFGLLLPALTDLINRRIKDSDIRWWISLGTAAVFGVFLNWIDTQFIFVDARMAFDSITSSIMIVFGLSQISYRVVWEDSKLREDLKLDATKVNQ